MMRIDCKRSGLALLMVLLLVASASVLAMGYIVRATVQLASSSNLVQSEQARYLAESAMDHALYVLRHDPDALDGSGSAPVGPFEIDEGGDRYYFGAAGVAGKPGQFLLGGSGVAGGITQSVTSRWFLHSEYLSAALAMRPKYYWRLGEAGGTTAGDLKDEHEGTYNGPTLGQPGGIILDANRAPQFDGQNDYVDLGNLDLEGSAVSIAAWVYPDRFDHLIGRDPSIVCKANGTRRNQAYWLIGTKQITDVTTLIFRLRTSGLAETVEMTGGDIPAEKWSFVVATYNGAEMKLYQDAVRIQIRPQSGDIKQMPHVGAWIGGNPVGPTARPWCGRIDEVAIYDHALSAGQILAMFNTRVPEAKVLAWDAPPQETSRSDTDRLVNGAVSVSGGVYVEDGVRVNSLVVDGTAVAVPIAR